MISALIEQQGLEFQPDKERVKYGESIKRFMDEIGAADSIIPVLSGRYFRSEFCMFELPRVWNNGNFETGGPSHRLAGFRARRLEDAG